MPYVARVVRMLAGLLATLLFAGSPTLIPNASAQQRSDSSLYSELRWRMIGPVS